MSIWFELLALSLAAYTVGLLLGWIVWGDITQPSAEDTPPSEPETSEHETQ